MLHPTNLREFVKLSSSWRPRWCESEAQQHRRTPLQSDLRNRPDPHVNVEKLYADSLKYKFSTFVKAQHMYVCIYIYIQEPYGQPRHRAWPRPKTSPRPRIPWSHLEPGGTLGGPILDQMSGHCWHYLCPMFCTMLPSLSRVSPYLVAATRSCYHGVTGYMGRRVPALALTIS